MAGKEKVALLRYVVPFEVKGKADYTQLVEKLNNAGNWETANPWEGEQDVYEYVTRFLTPDNNNIGQGWSLRSDDESSGYIIKNLDWLGEVKSQAIKIKCAGLYLFRNLIGFFWFETEYTNNFDYDKLINFQAGFKEFSHNSTQSKVKKKLGMKDGVAQYEDFPVGSWITETVEQAAGPVNFLPGRTHEGKPVPDKPLLFYYVTLPKSLATGDEPELAYCLTNGFKQSYDRPENFSERIYKPFKNVTWYASEAGCGQLAVYNDAVDAGGKKDKRNNAEFFLSNMKKRVERTYFPLYILLLYQNYSLIHYAGRLERDFPAEISQYDKETISKLLGFSKEIDVFLLKNVFASVSHIDHHNGFYQYVSERLNLKKDIASITVGLDSLNTLVQREVDKTEEDSDRIRDRALAFIALLAMVSVLCDGVQYLERGLEMLPCDFGRNGWLKNIVYIAFSCAVIRVSCGAVKDLGLSRDLIKKWFGGIGK